MKADESIARWSAAPPGALNSSVAVALLYGCRNRLWRVAVEGPALFGPMIRKARIHLAGVIEGNVAAQRLFAHAGFRATMHEMTRELGVEAF